MKASMTRPLNAVTPNGTMSPSALIESGFNIAEDAEVDPWCGLEPPFRLNRNGGSSVLF
jgi:hypothetical protein